MKNNHINRLVYSISTLFFCIIIWHVLASLTPSSVIPTPFEVLNSLIQFTIEGDNFGYTFFDHLWASLLRVILGFYFAFIIAVPLGLWIGLSKKAEWSLSPIIELLRPIPPFAWIPFALVLFGLGLVSQSFIIFIGAFFPILTNTIKGVQETSPIHIDVAKTLGAKKSDIIFYVVLPSTLPSIFVGIRIGLGVGWMCVIAAELVGLNVPTGLGYLIQYSAQFGNFGLTFATMLLTGLIGLGLSSLIKLFENRSLRWRDSIVKS
ncbi:MAG: ABC transporter permease [Candidatus Hodarchaeota archaeon]